MLEGLKFQLLSLAEGHELAAVVVHACTAEPLDPRYGGGGGGAGGQTAVRPNGRDPLTGYQRAGAGTGTSGREQGSRDCEGASRPRAVQGPVQGPVQETRNRGRFLGLALGTGAEEPGPGKDGCLGGPGKPGVMGTHLP